MRVIAFAWVIALAFPAHADVVPDDVAACRSGTCDGDCVPATCSRTLPPEPGGQPQVTEYECTRCVPRSLGSHWRLWAGLGVGLVGFGGAVALAKRRGRKK